MDPISTSYITFQEKVRTFLQNDGKKALVIVTSGEHIGSLAKMLRVEEWYQGNRSPLIIVDTPWSDDWITVEESVCYYIREHYAALIKGFEKDGITLPILPSMVNTTKEPLDLITENLTFIAGAIQEYCSAPLFCWLPTVCKKPADFIDGMRYLIEENIQQKIRLVISIEQEKYCKPLVKAFDETLTIIEYGVPEDTMQEYVKKLFAPAAAGHADGTPSGAAAPDVTPPPRKIAPPSDEQIQESVAKLGLGPVLLPRQAEALRASLFAAALAAGNNDADTALSEQLHACTICEDAGVNLEHALMRLTLANYYLQFQLEPEAMQEYRRAEQIAGEIPAYTQLAQIRMAQAFVCMRKKKRLEEAVAFYEQAAAAAAIGEVWLIYLESLRMLGTCHCKLKDSEAAAECWHAAVVRGGKMDKSEITGSTFLDIAARFMELLKKERLDEQAASVAAIVQEVGTQFMQEVAS